MALTDETLADLALSRSALDRVALERRRPEILTELLDDPQTRVVDIRGDRMHVAPGGGTAEAAGSDSTDDGLRLVLRAPEPEDHTHLGLHLGRDGEGTAYVGVVRQGADGGADPAEDGWLTLRQAGEALAPRDAGVFTTALALANWHATHRFCPRCGAPTEPVQAGWVRRCEREGSEHYPRTDPAVIMAVTDEADRILLGRQVHWPEGRFSTLAGFVEPGESIEQSVRREVYEEAGITVGEVEYVASQPWPFPSSLMLGFMARATSAVINVDGEEIEEARWFSREDLRAAFESGEVLPPYGISIAARLIELWYGKPLPTRGAAA